MARTAFYRPAAPSASATSCRILAFVLHEPSIAQADRQRRPCVSSGRRDVQHWWLPGTGAGVRTLISDDVVWPAYAIHHHCTVTGDKSVLDDELSFIEGPALRRVSTTFYRPEISEDKVEHIRACRDRARPRHRPQGANGMPLFLGGDWNDGMNRVGIGGAGTSVWLGWFLAGALRSFSTFAAERGDTARVERWSKHLAESRAALESAEGMAPITPRTFTTAACSARRKASPECQIDLIAQSWSVLSGGRAIRPCRQGDGPRCSRSWIRMHASSACSRRPSPTRPRIPASIKAYPPGVRENGGQYTHAATWVVMALAELNRGVMTRCVASTPP